MKQAPDPNCSWPKHSEHRQLIVAVTINLICSPHLKKHFFMKLMWRDKWPELLVSACESTQVFYTFTHPIQQNSGIIWTRPDSSPGLKITILTITYLFLTFFFLKSGSLSHIPDQRTRTAHWSAPRRTPPIARGRLNPIGGSKYSGPAYQHLQEVDSSEREAEAQRGWGEYTRGIDLDL